MITKNIKVLSCQKVNSENSIIGVAKVEVLNSFEIKVKILKGKQKNFISFPNYWDKSKGAFEDSIVFTDIELKMDIVKTVLDAFSNLSDEIKEEQTTTKPVVVNSSLLDEDDDDIPF